MKGRPNIHTDKELIMKAQEIFWQKGYNATSLSDLTNVTGAGAGSLYNTFKGGKKQLFLEALLQRREELLRFKQLLESSDFPVTLIRKFFLDIANADNNTHLKGCIIANTIIEMTFVDDELKEVATQILKETEQMYTSVIAQEQKNGNIKSTISAGTLGKFLISFWCGINALRRIYPDKKILKAQIELQLQILN